MSLNRRKFLTSTAMAGLGAMAFSAKSYARIIGANEKVNVGFMGMNSRGAGLLNSFVLSNKVNITNLCDVDSRVLSKMTEKVESYGFDKPKTNDDIRRTLEDNQMDAIVIAAPDHWHAPAGVMALQAGKHVYVEKPLSHNPREGEIFVEAQKKYDKIVQMGNQHRSSVVNAEAVTLIKNGAIGKPYRAETWYSNTRGLIGNGKAVNIPGWLNWDLWQGPAPRVEYHDNYLHYNWHWFWHWGTGEMCNNALHEVDVARWALGVEFPHKVSVTGGRYHHDGDDWEMYDTMEALYEFDDGKSISWTCNSSMYIKKFDRDRGTVVYGSTGYAVIDINGYELYDLSGKMYKKTLLNGQEARGSNDLVGAGYLTNVHAENFLDVIRGTESHQSSPVELGHTSTMLCHLGNIAYRIGENIECNPDNGHVIGEKAKAFWQREFQSGWEMKA